MKDLRVTKVILGTKIDRNDNGIVITQFEYVEKILKRFDIYKCILTSIPVNTSVKLIKNINCHVA